MIFLRKTAHYAAIGVMTFSFAACSTQSLDDRLEQQEERSMGRKQQRISREETWDDRFKRWSDNADRRAEARFDRLMY